MLAAAREAEVAAGGGEDMAEADEAEQMNTSDPLAYELSAALRAIAGLLQLDASGPSAEALVAVVAQRVQQLLAQLPAGFFEPLLDRSTLGDAQVGSGWAGWQAAAHASQPAAGTAPAVPLCPPQPCPSALSPAPCEQLAKLTEVDGALRAEYALRRRMLIERVKVTLQSFMWSPRLEQTVRSVAALSAAARAEAGPRAAGGTGRHPAL